MKEFLFQKQAIKVYSPASLLSNLSNTVLQIHHWLRWGYFFWNLLLKYWQHKSALTSLIPNKRRHRHEKIKRLKTGAYFDFPENTRYARVVFAEDWQDEDLPNQEQLSQQPHPGREVVSSQTSPGRKFPCSEEHCNRRKTLEAVGQGTYIKPGRCRWRPHQKAVMLHGKGNCFIEPGSLVWLYLWLAQGALGNITWMSASFSLSLKWGEPLGIFSKSVETYQWKNSACADKSPKKDA